MSRLWVFTHKLFLSLLFGLIAGCSGMGSSAGLPIPPPMPGKFNLAVVSAGDGTDLGWSQAHWLGVLAIRQSSSAGGQVHAEFIGGAAELYNQEELFRRLAEMGYNLIIGSEAGYMDSMEAAARRYPSNTFLTVRGVRHNGANYGSLDVPLETSYYVAGLAAGARIEADAAPLAPAPGATPGAPLPPTATVTPQTGAAVQRRVGILAGQVTPEQFRYINAAALGVHSTCPGCVIEVRFLKGWDNRERERSLAAEMLRDGAHVLLVTTRGQGAIEAVQDRPTRWLVLEALPERCRQHNFCLTGVYWNWAPVYLDLANKVQPGNFRAEVFYTAAANGIGLVGLMPNEAPTPGLGSLPQNRLAELRARVVDFQLGKWNSIDVFSTRAVPGGVRDNSENHNIIFDDSANTPPESSLRRKDINQFPPGDPENRCNPCIYWFPEWIVSELPWAGN